MSKCQITDFFRKNSDEKRQRGNSDDVRPTSSQDIPSCSKTTSDTESSVAQKHWCWRDKWQAKFPWLDKNQDEKEVLAICKWCTDMGKQNVFVSPGSHNLQHSVFKGHQTSPDHLLAAESWHTRKKGFTIQKQMERAQAAEDGRDANDPGKTALMRIIFCVAKNALPLNQVNNLMELQVCACLTIVCSCSCTMGAVTWGLLPNCEKSGCSLHQK